MARRTPAPLLVLTTVSAWLVGLIVFFPILWMLLTSFKTEIDAFSTPPSFLFFDWTLENYAAVQTRSNYLAHAWNSVVVALGSTLLAMAAAIPAAWSMAFSPTKRTRGILLWMLSTKMMPPVGVLVQVAWPDSTVGKPSNNTGWKS